MADPPDIYINQVDSFPLSKAIVLPNGYVRFVAPIARATRQGEKGFLNINQADGKFYYQRVSKELLDRTKGSFTHLPVTKGHPKSFLDSLNTSQHVKGFSGSSRESVLQVDNYLFQTGTLFDEDLIQAIKNKTYREISPGYKTKLTPIQNDECDQLDRIGNHTAFVTHGRNGSSVALQLDSSDIPWDSIMAEQYDEATIAEITKEINGLPASFLDLSYAVDTVNLDLVNLQKDSIISMTKLQLVTDKSTIVTVESEQCDELAGYINRLKDGKDQAIIAASQKVSKEQFDSAMAELEKMKTETSDTTEKDKKIASLEAQIEALRAVPKQQKDSAIDQSAVKAEAEKLALNFIKVSPHIVKLDPDFQFDSVPSLPELHRAYVSLAMPDRKSEFDGMQLDSATTEGQINAAKLQGHFEVLSTQNNDRNTSLQQDNAADQHFSRAFQQILTQGSVDQSDGDASMDAAIKTMENAWKTK